jgi:exodeoxyribonuclease VII large subunit
LGELSLTRRKILEKLQKEGLLDKNKKLALAEVPLRIGLITAPGSAAFKDFTTVLLQSGFSFQILLASARMQGAATESTVTEAFAALAKHSLDCICLVRGGGAKTDLVFFDSENICRAIAACPVPVLTGIGHEIDRSRADVVAHADLITPRDCAKYLEGRAAEAWEALRRRAASLSETWRLEYQESGYGVVRKAQWLRNSWEGRARRETQRHGEIRRGLFGGTKRIFQAMSAKLSQDLTGLRRGPLKLWRAERVALELKERLVQAADPAVLLGRGFALAYSATGQWIRQARDVAAGEEIRIRFLDGALRSSVKAKEDLPWKPVN